MTVTAQDRTDKTVRILRYIEHFLGANGYAPSLQDIMDGCGISSKSVVASNLGKLEQRGKLRRKPGTARSITLPHNVPW